ncbi:hypothetical protein NCCP1664_01790 [Zafaria cholistanensis]|uniref:Transposase n=1 Tax=Zafaria cholistanensis TaxID=1682741 RepID=A0A5A7NNB8_9MICC|nr:hypothetical protein NCCP1664_01790 [Zafaria cholistanensis]
MKRGHRSGRRRDWPFPGRTEQQHPLGRGRARHAHERGPDPGQNGDNPQLILLLDGIRVRRAGREGPRSRPEAVLADKAYSHPSTRAALRSPWIRFTSPEHSDQKASRAALGSKGSRLPDF